MAAGDPVHNEPPDIEHADVVVDMKKCDLVVVLPQDEEEGVHELDQLGEVVPPQDVYDLRERADEQRRGFSIFPNSHPNVVSPESPEKFTVNRKLIEQGPVFISWLQLCRSLHIPP